MLEGPGRRTVGILKYPGEAFFRRQFENAYRRPGSDPATFSTELGILALRGFSDMKEKARDLMVRNKFITSQQSCDLRRHLDSATPETSILDIVDSCRIWESHGERVVIENRGQNSTHRQPKLLMPPLATSSSQFRVGSVMPALDQSPRRVNHSPADRELLIRTVLQAVGACRGTRMDDEGDHGQCFSCGFFGHGVNRCPRLDRSFPYKTPGWSVDVRNGQYRASRMSGDEHDLRRGKEGWFGREGQPPGPSVTVTRLTQVGVIVRLGNDRRMTLMDPDGLRTCRASQSWGALLRRKRTAAIVQYRIVQRWFIRIKNWTRSVAQSGMGAIGLLWGTM